MVKEKGFRIGFSWWWGVGLALMVVDMYMIFVYAPTAQKEAGGIAQRIFYLMVPLAWNSFLAFFLTLLGGILYLVKRDLFWDDLAAGAGEVGLLFISSVIFIGIMWAKPTWGAWWVWDARLTSALILGLIYVAYFILRGYAGDRERAARFGAVVGIAGFIDVPIVALATTLWRTQHPQPLIVGGLDPKMLQTLLVSLVAFTLFFGLLLSRRVALRLRERELEELKGTLEG